MTLRERARDGRITEVTSDGQAKIIVGDSIYIGTWSPSEGAFIYMEEDKIKLKEVKKQMVRKELVPYSRTYADYVKDAGRCEEFLRTWITGVVAGLNEVDEEIAEKILKKSGEDCCKIFLEVYGYDLTGRDLDSLIELLDSNPGAGCRREEDNTVIYEFKPERCECILVERKMIELTPRLCSACFTNWLTYMFGTVTKKTVKAELIESLATGASKCAFRIRLV